MQKTLPVMLSPHFSLAEMMVSDSAERLGINNTPPLEMIPNLERTAELLETVRAVLGNKALIISSAYRSRVLNDAIRGSKNSFHIFGLAVDFICPKHGSPLDICHTILANPAIKFDQLICEYGRWVHLGLSFSNIKPRRDILTIDSKGARSGLLSIRV